MGIDLMVWLIVILPILSACIGFTVRYAIRPMIESLVDALHEVGRISGAPSESGRIAHLENEVAELRAQLQSIPRTPKSEHLLGNAVEEHL